MRCLFSFHLVLVSLMQKVYTRKVVSQKQSSVRIDHKLFKMDIFGMTFTLNDISLQMTLTFQQALMENKYVIQLRYL